MYFDYMFMFSSFIVLACTSVYLFAYREQRDRSRTAAHQWPGVSIIVPMWNEEKTITATLDSLLAMKKQYPGEVEIIVVDDNSTDASYTLVQSYAKTHADVSLHRKTGPKGKSESLNMGTRMARYALVGCVDADSYPHENALTHIVREFDNPQVGAATTKMVVNKPASMVEWFQYIEYCYSNFILMAFDSMDSIFITRGPLSLYRREVLLEIGGFLPAHQTPTEDMEITFRIRKAGYQIRASKLAKVYTSVMPTWKNLFWQRIRWNRGTLVNFWMHRDMIFDRRFGMFSMFVFPTSSLMVFMIAITLFYILYKLFAFAAHHVLTLHALVSAGKLTGMMYLSEVLHKSAFAVNTYSLLIMIAVFFFFFLINGFGIIESRERVKIKYVLYLVATPFVYNPILIIFWISAFVMHTAKNSFRWR